MTATETMMPQSVIRYELISFLFGNHKNGAQEKSGRKKEPLHTVTTMGCGSSRNEDKNFFNEEVKPLISNLMEINQLNIDEAYTLFALFSSMDKDKDGTLSCAEFHKMLGLKVTLVSERMYIMLMNGTRAHKETSFPEFLKGMCTLKGLSVADLGDFTYDIFDIDRKDSLSICEIDALLRMVKNEEEADPNFLKHLLEFFDGEGINKESFIKGIEQMPGILKLLLEVQVNLKALL